MRQSLKKRERNAPFRNEVKTLMKKELGLIEAGKTEEAVKLLPIAYKAIDTATKKYILNRKTADRRKSRLARALNDLQKNGVKAKVEKAPKAKKAVKAEKKAAVAA